MVDTHYDLLSVCYTCYLKNDHSKIEEIAGVWTKLEREQILLPSALQVATAAGKIYTDSPTISITNEWLYNWPGYPEYGLNNGQTVPYGYWTSTPNAENSRNAWSVYYNGKVQGTFVIGNPGIFGVRPVVNLKI